MELIQNCVNFFKSLTIWRTNTNSITETVNKCQTNLKSKLSSISSTTLKNCSKIASLLALSLLLIGPCYIYLWYKIAQLGHNFYLDHYENSWPKNSKDYGFVASLALALFFQFAAVSTKQITGCYRNKLKTVISMFVEILAAIFLFTAMIIWSHFRTEFQQNNDIFVRAFYLKKPGYLYNMGWVSFVLMLLSAILSFIGQQKQDENSSRVFDTRPGTGVTIEPSISETQNRPHSGFTRSTSSLSRPKTAKSIFFDMASVLAEEEDDVGSEFSQ